MKYIILLFSLSILLSITLPEEIGICTNVTGAVYRSGKIRSGKIRKGESIYNGDKVFTMDKNAFLSLLNTKDKSIISLYGNSVIKIFRYAKKDSIKTEINIFGGRVSAELRKTKNSKYIVNTPSSIAVSQETSFQVGHRTMNDHGPYYQGVSDCVFSVLTGKLNLQNTKSEKTIDIGEGKTVISTSNGEFLIFETTDQFTQYFKEPK